jgi:hypothetical protein
MFMLKQTGDILIDLLNEQNNNLINFCRNKTTIQTDHHTNVALQTASCLVSNNMFPDNYYSWYVFKSLWLRRNISTHNQLSVKHCSSSINVTLFYLTRIWRLTFVHMIYLFPRLILFWQVCLIVFLLIFNK